MKALFISNDPNIFDPQSAVRARLRDYAAAIGELHIISAGKREAQEEQDGVLHVYPVSGFIVFRIFAIVRKARAVIRARSIDVVSAQDPFEHGWAAARAVLGTTARLHIQVHTDFLSPYFAKESYKNRIRVRMATRILPRAYGIRVVSERIKQSLIARYANRIQEPVVIPIAVSLSVPTSTPLPPHSFSFALIAVGRLEKEKRVFDLLEALSLVRTKYPNTGLFIVGDGKERAALVRRARALGLSGNVIFLGNQPNARVFLAHAHAFVHASAYEGYGLSLVEAALAKVPIVTTDVGVVGEVFTAGSDVLASPVGDIQGVASNIVRLIEDNQLRRVLMLSAYDAVMRHLGAQTDQPVRIASDLASVLNSGNTSINS
ncbi:MAG: glycosyltransferase family 4 protein [Minisyncoccia bacterium]